MADVQVVGVIRFSVLAEGFGISLYGSFEELRDYLFAPESLEFRFHIFENMCLPTLASQTDEDFHLVLLTSEDLPVEAHDRLDQIAGKHPQITVFAVGVEKHHRQVRAAYQSVPLGKATHRAAFRLDNYDALCLTYVERLRHLSEGLLQLHDEDVPTILAFNHGFYVGLNPDGPNDVYDTTEREPLSTGTTLLSQSDLHLNPYRYNHRALAQHFNLYSDITTPTFLRTIHAENEDRVMKKGFERKMPERRVKRLVREHFGLSLSELQAP